MSDDYRDGYRPDPWTDANGKRHVWIPGVGWSVLGRDTSYNQARDGGQPPGPYDGGHHPFGYGPDRYDPDSTVIPEDPTPPPEHCAKMRCPSCGCVSLVNHCWYLWNGQRIADDETRRGTVTRSHYCDDLICFVCLARVGTQRDRVFVYMPDEQPAINRCCGTIERCERGRPAPDNDICCL